MDSDLKPKLISEKKIDSEIKKAIAAGERFYIGAAKEEGSAEESLENRGIGSKHHIDKKVSKHASLEKLFCTDLMSTEKVCNLEKRLIKKYKKDNPSALCLNGRSGGSHCIKTPRGIVYLRVYKKLRSVGKPLSPRN